MRRGRDVDAGPKANTDALQPRGVPSAQARRYGRVLQVAEVHCIKFDFEHLFRTEERLRSTMRRRADASHRTRTLQPLVRRSCGDADARRINGWEENIIRCWYIASSAVRSGRAVESCVYGRIVA